MTKYDQLLMPLFVKGSLIGYLFKKRTARQAAEETWAMAKLRKEYNDMMQSSSAVYKTPIVEEPE